MVYLHNFLADTGKIIADFLLSQDELKMAFSFGKLRCAHIEANRILYVTSNYFSLLLQVNSSLRQNSDEITIFILLLLKKVFRIKRYKLRHKSVSI
jgi:hypothetical protein